MLFIQTDYEKWDVSYNAKRTAKTNEVLLVNRNRNKYY